MQVLEPGQPLQPRVGHLVFAKGQRLQVLEAGQLLQLRIGRRGFAQVQSERRRRRGKFRQQTFFQEGEPECRQVAVHTFLLRDECKCPLAHPADFGAGLLPGGDDLRWQGYAWAFFAGCRAGGPAEGADRQHSKGGHPAHGSLPYKVSGLHDTPRWIDSAGRQRAGSGGGRRQLAAHGRRGAASAPRPDRCSTQNPCPVAVRLPSAPSPRSSRALHTIIPGYFPVFSGQWARKETSSSVANRIQKVPRLITNDL